MRVLLITGEFPPMQGGVGDYTFEIARELAAQSVQVRVLTSEAAGAATYSATSGLSLVVVPSVSRWDWASHSKIKSLIRDFAPQIVHVQYQTGAYGMHPAINLLPRSLNWRAGLAGSTLRPRVVTTFHDLRIPYLFPKAGRVRDWVTRELACSSDAVIATNPADYDRLETWKVKRLSLVPIGSNVTTILPPGYDRAALRRNLGVKQDELLLCHFGFVNDRKGCDTLVRALVHVPNGKLLMMGGQVGASDRTNVAAFEKLQAQIAELGLTARVLWTGFTPPEIVTANFRAADLCVLPYREGASYQHGTLMAAIAHALPIITTAPRASNRSPLPPLCNEENCLLVPPDDDVALAQAIQRAANSPELRVRISQGACELARHFTWDKIVQQHLELYNRILGP